jgi:hypothetical protein
VYIFQSQALLSPTQPDGIGSSSSGLVVPSTPGGSNRFKGAAIATGVVSRFFHRLEHEFMIPTFS